MGQVLAFTAHRELEHLRKRRREKWEHEADGDEDEHHEPGPRVSVPGQVATYGGAVRWAVAAASPAQDHEARPYRVVVGAEHPVPAYASPMARLKPSEGERIMARKVADCRQFPSEVNCTLTISGEEQEVLNAAVAHAVAVHGHKESPELRETIRGMLTDEVPARA